MSELDVDGLWKMRSANKTFTDRVLEDIRQAQLKRRIAIKAYSSLALATVLIVATVLLLSSAPWIAASCGIGVVAFGVRFLIACDEEEKRLNRANSDREANLIQANQPEPDWYDAAQAAGLFKPIEIEVGHVDPGFLHHDNETFLADLAEELLTPEERLAREVELDHADALEIESSRNKPTVVVPPPEPGYSSGILHNAYTVTPHTENVGRFAKYDRESQLDFLDLRSLEGRIERLFFDRVRLRDDEVADMVRGHLRKMDAEDRLKSAQHEENVVRIYGDDIVQNVYTGTGVAL